MALGRKSIYTVINVTNNVNPEKPHKVTVQANKNYGICDVLLVTELGTKVRITEVLSVFQGRQINDSNVVEHLWNVLNEVLNSVKE